MGVGVGVLVKGLVGVVVRLVFRVEGVGLIKVWMRAT